MGRKGRRKGAKVGASAPAPGRDPFLQQMAAARQHRDAGDWSQAVACYRQILAQDPDHAEANRGIAACLQVNEQAEMALAHWERALSVEPNNVGACFNYARCLHMLQRLDESLARFQLGFEKMKSTGVSLSKTDLADTHFKLGLLYRDLHQDEDEEKCLSRAVSLNPELAGVHFEHGLILGQLGRIDESILAYRRALRIDPDLAAAHRALAMARKHTQFDDELTAAESLYESGQLDDDKRVHLAFGLGKACEDLKQHQRAFRYWVEGNRMYRRLYPYVVDAELAVMDSLRKTFSSAYIGREGAERTAGITPVFIISMPRAGSSLVEQILASHSEIYGGGEMMIVWDLMRQAAIQFPDDLGKLKQADWERLGVQYLEQVTRPMHGEAFITDKLPGNFAMVGAIRMMFPNAKVVHCCRDPMDTALSCFKNSFMGDAMLYSYDLADLGAFYKVYEKMIAHWRKVLPTWVYDIHYENLTADPEAEVRKLLEFIGLPFEEPCLSFYQTKRSTRTASSIQVREPIYQTSVKKWKNFERELQPFRKARKGGFYGL